MNKEMQKMIKKNKQEAKELIQYANPKSKKQVTIKRITEILLRHIPYCGIEKPIINKIDVIGYSKNDIIKSAKFQIKTTDDKKFQITAYQNLKGRSQEVKDRDKKAEFPSGLFNIFTDEIK